MNYPFPCLTRDRRGIDRFLYVSFDTACFFAAPCQAQGQDSSNMIIMIMKNEDFNCPIPLNDADCVLMAHGGGGRMTHQLISNIFYPAFHNPLLEQDHDGCVFPVQEGRMACSTDSFVVDPIFFPGGDIGDPGGERDGERPCLLRCPSALPHCRVHTRRGPAACRPATHRAVHEEGGRQSRRARLSPVIPRWWNVANATNSLSIPAASESSPKASASPPTAYNPETQ